mmetsp:Transcript_2856/g.4094  ORF Transcript_2856/g.4094 Transcript_2856/m.4094 type:complete len:141 (-) Transcript_2856:1668-2090(-)
MQVSRSGFLDLMKGGVLSSMFISADKACAVELTDTLATKVKQLDKQILKETKKVDKIVKKETAKITKEVKKEVKQVKKDAKKVEKQVKKEVKANSEENLQRCQEEGCSETEKGHHERVQKHQVIPIDNMMSHKSPKRVCV